MPSIDVNDTRLFYTETGGGPHTVVMSHGLLMDHSMFEELTTALYGRYRVIAYDHRGQGQSWDPPQGEDLDTLTEDAAALIDALCPGQRVHFIGMSMGGMVGLRLAARHPDKVRSLTLIDTSAAAESPWHRIKFETLCKLAAISGVKPFVPVVMREMFGHSTRHDASKQALIQRWRAHVSALPKSIVRQVRAVMQREDVRGELGAIACPTLVLCGSEDKLTPAKYSRDIARCIRGADLKMIENAGHSSNLEQPQVVNLAVFRFLESIDA